MTATALTVRSAEQKRILEEGKRLVRAITIASVRPSKVADLLEGHTNVPTTVHIEDLLKYATAAGIRTELARYARNLRPNRDEHAECVRKAEYEKVRGDRWRKLLLILPSQVSGFGGWYGVYTPDRKMYLNRSCGWCRADPSKTYSNWDNIEAAQAAAATCPRPPLGLSRLTRKAA